MKNEIRIELELYVLAWNKCLKDVVEYMDNVILLRNAHPAYRAAFANSMLDQKMISKLEASEFVQIVGK